MAEEKKEPWLNYLALTTVILAVCATLSTFKGGGWSTKSVISQAQASDEWAHYQSKSIKQYQYDLQADKLELELPGVERPELIAAYRKKIDDYRKKSVQYEADKKEITGLARGLEKARDEAQRHSAAFGIAVIFLQVGVLLCSVAALMKIRALWVLGATVGSIGVVWFANGFLLFFS